MNIREMLLQAVEATKTVCEDCDDVKANRCDVHHDYSGIDATAIVERILDEHTDLCFTCKGSGNICIGTSGLESDGNAPVLEICPECGYGEQPSGGLTDEPAQYAVDPHFIGVQAVWDVFDGKDWFMTVTSPLGWDAWNVREALTDQRYAPHLNVIARHCCSNGNPVSSLAAEVERLRAIEQRSASQGQEPVPFVLGNQYLTQSGEWVRFVTIANEGTDYESMADEKGCHRYTRRDFGRVTGSAHDYSDPLNTPPLYLAPPLAVLEGWQLVPKEINQPNEQLSKAVKTVVSWLDLVWRIARGWR